MRHPVPVFALSALLAATAPGWAGETPVVSTWGGSFRDLIDEPIATKFKAETGADVQHVTGGTIDRLNKAKLAKDAPETDVTFITAHVGWLSVNDGLYERLDLDKIPSAKNLVDQAKVSPYHLGPGVTSTPLAIAGTSCPRA